MLFEGNYGKIFELCMDLSKELKVKVGTIMSFIPHDVKQQLEKGKKINIKTNKETILCKKYKADGAHQLVFKYEKDEYKEDCLMSLNINVTTLDEKFLNRIPLYNESDKGIYSYNYILSVDYSANHKVYEYEVEIRRLSLDNYALVVNYYKPNNNESIELETVKFTKLELLSKTRTKGR